MNPALTRVLSPTQKTLSGERRVTERDHGKKNGSRMQSDAHFVLMKQPNSFVVSKDTAVFFLYDLQ